MKYAAVVTIDVGHSNAKLTVTTADSLIQEQAIVSNCWRCPPPYLHADVDGIWSWILFTLKSFSSRYFIESIVVSAHGAAAALIADNGLALPILDYEHDEYCEINDEYESLARNFKLTFSPLYSTVFSISEGSSLTFHHFVYVFQRYVPSILKFLIFT